jgi:hypothetical protein
VKVPAIPPVAGTSAYEKPKPPQRAQSDMERCAHQSVFREHILLPACPFSSLHQLCADGPLSWQTRKEEHETQTDRRESFQITCPRPRIVYILMCLPRSHTHASSRTHALGCRWGVKPAIRITHDLQPQLAICLFVCAVAGLYLLTATLCVVLAWQGWSPETTWRPVQGGDQVLDVWF